MSALPNAYFYSLRIPRLTEGPIAQAAEPLDALDAEPPAQSDKAD
jgi:hypothetical protein